MSSEGAEEFLPADYREILSQAADLRADNKRRPFQLERLYGMITDMYIDKFKFQVCSRALGVHVCVCVCVCVCVFVCVSE